MYYQGLINKYREFLPVTETTPVVTPIPTISSIDTSRGISDVRIYWDVDKHVSGTTYTIYVKQSGGSWVAKTTLTSVPSSGYTSINVNKSNTLSNAVRGSAAGLSILLITTIIFKPSSSAFDKTNLV